VNTIGGGGSGKTIRGSGNGLGNGVKANGNSEKVVRSGGNHPENVKKAIAPVRERLQGCKEDWRSPSARPHGEKRKEGAGNSSVVSWCQITEAAHA